jgi:hypothetical protein
MPKHLVNNQPIVSEGATPSVTLEAAAGSNASVAIIGNNIGGRIDLTTGLNLLTTGKVMTLSLANGMQFPNGAFITFTAANANFASVLNRLYAVTTKTGIELYVAFNALSINTTYSGYYSITGY